MVGSSQVLRSARRGCQKGPVAPSAREDAVDCVAAPSDDGSDLGYITYLLVDYEMNVRYRFAMLRIMREQSCNDGEDAQGTHQPQGQVASIACFRPVSPCSCRRAGPPQLAPGCARFLFASWSLRGGHRRQVVPGVLFLSCYLQEEESGETRYSSSSRNGSAA